MNIDLLKKLPITLVLGLTLTACGGPDKGISTGLNGSEPIKYEGPIVVSVNEESGMVVQDLLSGAVVGADETIILRNVYRKIDSAEPPENAVLFKGTELTIDTDVFAREVAFGESLSFEYSYIIENGGGAIVDAEGNEISRDISITINGIKDPVESITLSHNEVRVPPGFELPVSANLAPVYATDKSVNWNISNTTYATVDANGNVTGLVEGVTDLTATSVDNPDVSITVPVNVTFDIPDPIGMVLVDIKGNDIGASMDLPACVSFPLTANQLPLVNGFTNPITWTSSDETKVSVTNDGVLTSFVDAESSDSVLITATNDQGLSDQVSITVVKNIACNLGGNSNFDFAGVKVWPWDGGNKITKMDSAEGIGNSNALYMKSQAGSVGITKAIDWAGSNPMIPEIGKGAGKFYKVSFWVKNLGTDPTQINLFSRGWIGSWHSDVVNLLGDVAVSSEWQYIEFDPIQDKPWDSTEVIWLQWGFPAISTTSEVLIDNLAIYEVSAP
ncbi:Ig-like domain-containing protein [Pseudocolwellia agarivorans]|uniref:Ig-like domain-containing protein n=1 Tax=Pseudocolwellia agarivorans TaxID=1911682 RepID=UPI0009867329|nr:Ig-like domain-containing protein [Pseudocolwellia agarivorans]